MPKVCLKKNVGFNSFFKLTSVLVASKVRLLNISLYSNCRDKLMIVRALQLNQVFHAFHLYQVVLELS